MLYQKDFIETVMARKGFGGQITVATNTTDSTRYVIKLNERIQSLKEYVAQKLIAALGYYSIPVEWYCDVYGNVYGALKFMDDLKKIGLFINSDLTVEQKQTMLFHLSLSCVLGNPDCSEVFLLNVAGESADDKDICSLDYGEALSDNIPSVATFSDNVIGHLKTITEVSQKLMTATGDFGPSEIERACFEAVLRLSELDITKLDSTMNDIERYFGKGQKEWHRVYLNDLKTACSTVVAGRT